MFQDVARAAHSRLRLLSKRRQICIDYRGRYLKKDRAWSYVAGYVSLVFPFLKFYVWPVLRRLLNLIFKVLRWELIYNMYTYVTYVCIFFIGRSSLSSFGHKLLNSHCAFLLFFFLFKRAFSMSFSIHVYAVKRRRLVSHVKTANITKVFR